VVVAEGLYNPRYMAFADDGTMYVTEVGVGGDEMFGAPAPEASPVTDSAEATPLAEEEAGPPPTRGYTGQISAITPDGTQSVVVSGLASYSDGVGPVGITIQDGIVYFTVGGAAVLAGAELLDGENCLFAFDPASGEVTQIAEFSSYEIDNNPDGTDINPNLYAVSSGDNDGRLTVNDAGSNTVFSVDVTNGALQLKAVVPDLAALLPESDNEPRQPVPTGGVFHKGGYHITLLSEFWPEDGPSVLKIDGDGDFASFTSVTTGRSFLTGIASGPDGNLYVSQLFDDPTGPPVGTIFRILPDATAEAVVEGLVMPHGITFDGDGNLFVTTMVLMSGPGAPAGQIVRIDGIAAPA
jgi:sugar lactone lactonase YvrE